MGSLALLYAVANSSKILQCMFSENNMTYMKETYIETMVQDFDSLSMVAVKHSTC